ncbi:type II toxin-antitoxin system RelE/ParE family toxin [Fibrella sp. HMF5335]|uniref:Type II toxin-antitoxin system RelE/ParE family toxin n=1 Tax=Fibrella rubiginis TaxID=2817060 RepID=A0A939GLM3_9BACT|nr:type II toxin-antitoxin system RelE/ParE family toxin [Fibrella rubiginis]MBO0939614.1 type II toxin-antitoxin system RelE/ParE family toxin [Fibrella rubiginis]
MSDLLITFTPEFKREYKRMAKKHASLNADFQALITYLQENPSMGTPLGQNAYKIRLAISSKNKGKSGGARVITYYLTADNELYLLSIYDKSEQSTVTDKALMQLIDRAVTDK